MADYPRVNECIFCRIVAGEIPCHVVYEDEDVLAFLDVNPLSLGHTLLIPKGHYAQLDEMPDELGAKLGAVLPALCRSIRASVNCKGLNVLQNNGRVAGQVVDHVHFHLIPRYQDAGLLMRWDAGKLPPGEAAETLAITIRGQMSFPTA